MKNVLGIKVDYNVDVYMVEKNCIDFLGNEDDKVLVIDYSYVEKSIYNGRKYD